MNISRNLLIVLVVGVFVGGAGTAYAGLVLPTITLGGNVIVIGDLDVNGSIDGSTINGDDIIGTNIDGNVINGTNINGNVINGDDIIGTNIDGNVINGNVINGTIIGATADDQHTKFHLLSEGSKAQPSTINQFVHYKISGGVVGVPTINSQNNSLIFPISAHADGELIVLLPRELIDAKSGISDDIFSVLIDSQVTVFEETKTSDERIMTFNFPNGSTLIEIIGTSTSSATAQITILGGAIQGCQNSDSCFSPTNLIIKKGITVTWLNPLNGTAGHQIVSGVPPTGDGLYNSGLFFAGETFSYQFNDPGEFTYFDVTHTWETGTIFVDG